MIRYSFKIFCVAFSACFCCAGSLLAEDNNPHTDKMMNEKLNLTQEWDKVFPKSDKVTHRKVSFRNRYGIMLAADLYMPRNVNEKLPAIAVSGPFGAVKEQSAGLYAQTMAERGFLTIAFDPSYTGESGGFPAMSRLRISIRRISAPPSITFPPAMTWIRNVLESLAFATGAAWRSMRRLSTPASRQR